MGWKNGVNSRVPRSQEDVAIITERIKKKKIMESSYGSNLNIIVHDGRIVFLTDVNKVV